MRFATSLRRLAVGPALIVEIGTRHDAAGIVVRKSLTQSIRVAGLANTVAGTHAADIVNAEQTGVAARLPCADTRIAGPSWWHARAVVAVERASGQIDVAGRGLGRRETAGQEGRLCGGRCGWCSWRFRWRLRY